MFSGTATSHAEGCVHFCRADGIGIATAAIQPATWDPIAPSPDPAGCAAHAAWCSSAEEGREWMVMCFKNVKNI